MKILLLIAVLAIPALPQRCGDSLLLYLRDQTGKIILPSDFESATVSATYTVDNVDTLVDVKPELMKTSSGIQSFSVRAECGIKLAQFKLRYKGQSMTIRVLNVPGDVRHILMEGIVFRKDSFEVDLGNRPMKNVEEYDGQADQIRWVIRDKSLRKVD
ncbi:MAG: hypothetical protein WBV94_32250 [Blastocatellia bacterium]